MDSSIYFLGLQGSLFYHQEKEIMNQTLLIVSLSLGFLLFVALVFVFFISRKSQRVMESLLEIMTNPEQAKIQDATRVLQLLLKDEINKIDANFKSMGNTLNVQIQKTEQIKDNLSTQNDRLVELANDATKKIANMSQRLENTTNGLQTIVNSGSWQDVQHITDSFSANMEVLLNKISDTTATTTEKSGQISEQINQCIENEKQISQQLQSSFDANNENMNNITNAAGQLQQQLTDLSANVTDGFNNVKSASSEYDETMHQNDKLLNDYLTKLSEFTKRTSKELIKQANTLTETANIVASAVRLAESSIDKQIRKLEFAIESLNNSTTTTQNSVRGVATELTGLTNRFNGEIHDFSTGVVKELQDVSGVANTTLENTKSAATEFANSVKSMGIGVRETLIEMNKAHTQLSGQSENLIKMSTETTEQLKPLSELIEKYYAALPDLSTGSKDMAENLEQIVNTLVDKINLMKTTISESLVNINDSSVQLGDLAGQSRQQMIDLMSDYTKAVDAMQSLNKQMMIARASAPMDAIKATPVPGYKPLSTKDFLNNVDKLFEKLYEQSVDLTRASGSDIPDIVWKKYNDGDNKIFAKWLVKMLDATDKKQIRELLKSDKVFNSQATQFIRNFEKILAGAEQTNDADKLKSTLLKTDLGTIYNTIRKSM
jgi:methyl-accepting chemotaxis protein